MKKNVMLTLVTLLIVGPWLGLWPSHVKAIGPYVFTGGGDGTINNLGSAY
jgi:hypothetical protein